MQYLLNGIIVGCIIVLGSTGFSMLYALLGFPNLAYGELMILAAYITLFINSLGVPVYLALILAIPVTGFVLVIIDRIVFKRLRNANLSTLIMASFGVALFLRSLIRVVWGSSAHFFETPPPIAVKLPFNTVISSAQITIIAYTALLIILLHLFLKKTKLGKATRAVADNGMLAEASGISTEKIVFWNLIIAGILALSGGVFLGIDSSLNPLQGWRLLLPVYAATIFGKVGSMYGAMVGGLFIGLAQEGLVAFLPTAYKPGIAFAAIIIVIFVRSGMFRQIKALVWNR